VLAALRDTRGRKPAPPARSGRDWAYGPCPMAAARMRRSRLCGACQKRRVRCSWSLKLQRCRPGKRANGRRGSPDSAFQRAKRESLDDMALSEGHHKDRRDGGEERGGGHLAIADVVFLREAGDADGDRVRVGGARQAEREQKFLPAKDENQHGGSGDAGARQRQHDMRETLEVTASVDGCRFFQFGRNFREKAVQHPEGERQVENGVRHDGRQRRVVNAEGARVQVIRADEDDRRQHVYEHQPAHDEATVEPAPAEAAEAVRAERRYEQNDQHAAQTRDDAVAREQQEVAAPPEEQLFVVGQGWGEEEAAAEHVAQQLERCHQRVEQRPKHDGLRRGILRPTSWIC